MRLGKRAHHTMSYVLLHVVILECMYVYVHTFACAHALCVSMHASACMRVHACMCACLDFL